MYPFCLLVASNAAIWKQTKNCNFLCLFLFPWGQNTVDPQSLACFDVNALTIPHFIGGFTGALTVISTQCLWFSRKQFLMHNKNLT